MLLPSKSHGHPGELDRQNRKGIERLAFNLPEIALQVGEKLFFELLSGTSGHSYKATTNEHLHLDLNATVLCGTGCFDGVDAGYDR
jgi:hypothetical protein